MSNKIRFQIQVRDFENCLLLSSHTLETDCSTGCNVVAQNISKLKNEVLDVFPDVGSFYFQAYFVDHPTIEQIQYFDQNCN